MSDPVETIERAGFTAKVFQDADAASPDDWSNVGTIAWYSRGTTWGEMNRYWQDYGLKESVPAQATVALPIYASEGRGGTELSLADDWDRANGWIYATAETVQTCMGDDVSEEDIRACLVAELEAWNQYLSGDVYGYVVKDPQGEQVDSCWGFYGLEYAIAEAREALDLPAVRLLEQYPALAHMVIW